MFFDDEGCWGDAVSGSRTTYLYQLYHPSFGNGWGYFSVWSYWLSVVFIGMAEITAISDYVRFWFPPGLVGWFNCLLTILALVNLIAVKLFGEVEFWFAMVKIVAILAMIATGVFMVLTGFKTPHGVASLVNISDKFSFSKRSYELCHGLSNGIFLLSDDWVYRGDNFWNKEPSSGLAQSC